MSIIPLTRLLYSPFFSSLSTALYIKPNSLSAEVGELTSVRFCSDTTNLFKVASERLLTCSLPKCIRIQSFRGLSLLAIISWTVHPLSRLVWQWNSGYLHCLVKSCAQRVNEKDNRLTMRKLTGGTRYSSACPLILIPTCPLKSTLLYLQFKEAFSITLISSTQ